jgi:ribose-phosphate pyrophosphokinase
MLNRLKLFTGNANVPLAQAICDVLDIPLGRAEVKSFSDGEVWVEIQENVRGMDVFVVQSTCHPCNTNLMELLVMIDALKRASAERITAVLPYYGYARQDRKVAGRTPITAKLVADLITAAGTNRVLTMDLHAGQIQGFFNIPVDHLFAAPVLLDYIRRYFDSNLVIVSPDAGGVERARAFAKRLSTGLAIIDKRRTAPNVADVMTIIGEVEGKDAILIDDMIDTADTVTKGAQALAAYGARRVFACATHAVLSGPAIDRILASPIQEVVVTDTIPFAPPAAACPKLRVLTVSGLLAEAIKRIYNDDSVSSLFV